MTFKASCVFSSSDDLDLTGRQVRVARGWWCVFTMLGSSTLLWKSSMLAVADPGADRTSLFFGVRAAVAVAWL